MQLLRYCIKILYFLICNLVLIKPKYIQNFSINQKFIYEQNDDTKKWVQCVFYPGNRHLQKGEFPQMQSKFQYCGRLCFYGWIKPPIILRTSIKVWWFRKIPNFLLSKERAEKAIWVCFFKKVNLHFFTFFGKIIEFFQAFYLFFRLNFPSKGRNILKT